MNCFEKIRFVFRLENLFKAMFKTVFKTMFKTMLKIMLKTMFETNIYIANINMSFLKITDPKKRDKEEHPTKLFIRTCM